MIWSSQHHVFRSLDPCHITSVPVELIGNLGTMVYGILLIGVIRPLHVLVNIVTKCLATYLHHSSD